MAQRIQLRRGSTSAWTTANPVLAEGEIGVDLTTGALRVGDGTSQWTDLGDIGQGLTSDQIAALEALEDLGERNAADGYAGLDEEGLVDNSVLPTDIVRTSDLTNAINALVDGAPGALDTLNELAAALGDDENFATTVTNAISAKLDASHASDTTDVHGITDTANLVYTDDARLSWLPDPSEAPDGKIPKVSNGAYVLADDEEGEGGGGGGQEDLAAGLYIDSPVGGLGGTISTTALTLAFLADAMPVGGKVFTYGQTDPATNLLWVHTGGGEFEPVADQVLVMENVGRVFSASSTLTGDAVIKVVGTNETSTEFFLKDLPEAELALDDLSDVDTAGTVGDVLKKGEEGFVFGGIALDDLSDVDTADGAAGKVLGQLEGGGYGLIDPSEAIEMPEVPEEIQDLIPEVDLVILVPDGDEQPPLQDSRYESWSNRTVVFHRGDAKIYASNGTDTLQEVGLIDSDLIVARESRTDIDFGPSSQGDGGGIFWVNNGYIVRIDERYIAKLLMDHANGQGVGTIGIGETLWSHDASSIQLNIDSDFGSLGPNVSAAISSIMEDLYYRPVRSGNYVLSSSLVLGNADIDDVSAFMDATSSSGTVTLPETPENESSQVYYHWWKKRVTVTRIDSEEANSVTVLAPDGVTVLATLPPSASVVCAPCLISGDYVWFIIASHGLVDGGTP